MMLRQVGFASGCKRGLQEASEGLGCSCWLFHWQGSRLRFHERHHDAVTSAGGGGSSVMTLMSQTRLAG
jgi:hypothetical protein